MADFDGGFFKGKGSSSSASYLNSRKERIKAKRQEQAQLAVAKEAEKAKASAPQGEGFFRDTQKNIGAVAGAVGEGLTSAYKRVGEGLGEAAYDITGGNKRDQDAYEAATQENFDTMMKLTQSIKNTTDPEKKKRLEDTRLAISRSNDELDKARQSRLDEVREKVDPVKGGAAVGEIGLDIVTGGTLKIAKGIITGTKAVRAADAAVTAAKVAEDAAKASKGAKAAANATKVDGTVLKTAKDGTQTVIDRSLKGTAKKVGKGVAAGAPIGAGYGALGTLEEEGSDASLGDVAKGAATGAAFGAALPVAGGAGRLLKNVGPVKQVDKFINDSVDKALQKVGESKFGQTVGNVSEKISSKLVDSLAPVVRDFGNAVDAKTGRKITEEVREKSTNVVNSAAINEGNLKNNAGFNKLKEILAPEGNEAIPGAKRGARKEAKEIGAFINEKQDAINFNKTKKAKEAMREVPVGNEKQEQAYKALNDATKPVIQYAYDNNLITKANYTKYMADGDYTRVQKDMSDLIDTNFKGAGGPNASISSTPFQQKLNGQSDRKSIDPFVSFYDWSNKVTKAAQRQNLSSYIIEQRKGMGKGKGYIRDADSVEARAAASGEAAQLRVLRNALGKAGQIESRYGKKLAQDINNLSKKGKNLSIKEAGTKGTATAKSGMKRQIDTLVDVSTAELKRIRKQIGNRDKKYAAHVDNLIGIKTQHEVAAKAVKNLTDIARKNRDGVTKNKATIKTFNRGIKEIWEDEPRIVNAINKVGRVEMHAVLKVLTFPSTIVQRTATSLNSVFALKNLVRDQSSSFINSKNGMATHTPISFMLGMKEAVAKPLSKTLLETIGANKLAKKMEPSEQYEMFLKYVAGQNQVDITRQLKKAAAATYETLGLKNENPLRKFEAISSATENATRYQNFVGTYRNAVGKGLDEQAAYKEAMQAARENSVDFAQSGDWAPFLKIFNPFFNATIQGTRSLTRAMKERPVGTALKVATTIGVPVAASTYYNLSDPQRALIYSQLSETDREGNLIFITEDGSVVKLPLPPGVREFAAPVRGVIEAEYGISDPETFMSAAGSALKAVNPFSGNPIGTVTPVFAKPLVENWANKNFFTDKEIIPASLATEDPDAQVFEGTSQTYRDLGKAFGISPLMVQNVIRGYTAGTGEQSIALYDQLRAAGGVKNEEGNPIATSDRNVGQQIKSGFFADKPDQQKAANNSFFKAYDPLKAQRDKASSEVTKALENGENARAKRLAEEFNQSLRGKFGKFNNDYGTDNKTVQQEEYWDDMISGLYIGTSEASFKARLR